MSTNRPGITEHYVERAAGRLRVLSTVQAGEEQTPLVILNGIGASADLLRPLVKAIARPCLPLDLPGVGASQPKLILGMTGYINAVAAVLDHFNVKQCDLMGVSWGGMLAQRLAVARPEAVRRLILSATMSLPAALPSPVVLALMSTPLRYLSASYFRLTAGHIYGGDFRRSRALVEQQNELMSPPALTAYFSQLVAINSPSNYWLARKINAPTLVLSGKDDPIVPAVNATLTMRRLKNAQHVEFDCGHLFVLTRQEAVCASTNAFLDAD